MIGEDLIKDLKDADREMGSKGLHNGCIIVDDSLPDKTMITTRQPEEMMPAAYSKYLKGYDYCIFISREVYSSIIGHCTCLTGNPIAGLPNFSGMEVIEVGALRNMVELEAAIDSGALDKAVISLVERVDE